jgi:hypothetical protein
MGSQTKRKRSQVTFEDVLNNVDLHKVNRYKEYWNNVAPQTDGEIFQRWLFAYTSIHTTWESNVRAYNHIKNFEQWINNKSKLSELLILSRAGLQQNRLEAIWDFKNKFFENPNQFKKSSDESWFSLRNRLAKDLKGIGLAKTSFALELCYPNSVGVVCLDVHILRLLNMNILGYKVSSNKDVNANSHLRKNSLFVVGVIEFQYCSYLEILSCSKDIIFIVLSSRG